MPIRIDDPLHDQARAQAQAERRTALDNPDLPIDFVRDLIVARAEGRALASEFVPES